VCVGPVGSFKVGRYARVGGAKEVEEEEEIDRGNVVVAGREGRMMGLFPGFC
jgi:hypothetical protein